MRKFTAETKKSDRDALRRSRGGLLNVFARQLFPPTCLICGRAVEPLQQNCEICGICRARLPWRNWENRVLPLLSWRYKLSLSAAERRLSAELFCLLCFHYEGELPRLLRQLKFSGKLSYALTLGHFLGEPILNHCDCSAQTYDVICPVPLSPRRAAQRGYNQAAELARVAADSSALPCALLLEKPEERPRQSEFDYAQRLDNAAGAFRSLRPLDGLKVILVDDVLTSGATLFSAAACLRAAGAKSVLCAAVAGGRGRELQNIEWYTGLSNTRRWPGTPGYERNSGLKDQNKCLK